VPPEHSGRRVLECWSVLHNNEMQRTKHGLNGASPLISVFCGRHTPPMFAEDGEA
jgi:hypothetical protein